MSGIYPVLVDLLSPWLRDLAHGLRQGGQRPVICARGIRPPGARSGVPLEPQIPMQHTAAVLRLRAEPPPTHPGFGGLDDETPPIR